MSNGEMNVIKTMVSVVVCFLIFWTGLSFVRIIRLFNWPKEHNLAEFVLPQRRDRETRRSSVAKHQLRRRHTIDTFSVSSLSNRLPLPERATVVFTGFLDDATEFPEACVGVQLADRPT